MGLLNSIMAGVGSPALTAGNHICDKAGLVSCFVSFHFFDCVHYKFNACFYLTIALVVI